MQTINCQGKLINLETPKIMGILNITPDSFYDGGVNNSILSALKQTEKMLLDGADFIDIGGMSSRPEAELISVEEEKNRVLPVLKEIVKEFPKAIISIDTFRSDIANVCFKNGASIINDISAGNLDDKMFEVTSLALRCPIAEKAKSGTFIV